MSEKPAARVLYLIDERPTVAFVEHWLKKAVDRSAPVPDSFSAAAGEMRELLARVAALQQAGLECEVGTTEAGAIERVIASSPTLVILDVVVYNKRTRRLQRELKHHAATRHIPLIILTNDGRPRLRLRAAQVGYEGYLVKPAKPIQLCTELRRIGVAIGASIGMELPGAQPAS